MDIETKARAQEEKGRRPRSSVPRGEARNRGYKRRQGCCGGAGVVSGGFGCGFSGEPGELGFELLGWPKGLAFEG